MGHPTPGGGGAELDVLALHRADLPASDRFAAQANACDPEINKQAAADPGSWCASWVDKLEWIEPYRRLLDWSDPPLAKWFVGGKLNALANCLDRQLAAGRGERVATHWVAEAAAGASSGREGRRAVTYAELSEMAQRFASALRGLGVGKGDVIGIYLPMLLNELTGWSSSRPDRRMVHRPSRP